jgi:hypothetical protein
MKYDYEDYEKFVTDQALNLYDAFFDEHREFEPCEFEDFEKWLKENKLDEKFETFAWVQFENYRQNSQEVIYDERD